MDSKGSTSCFSKDIRRESSCGKGYSGSNGSSESVQQQQRCSPAAAATAGAAVTAGAGAAATVGAAAAVAAARDNVGVAHDLEPT